ncbi:hypothetical protein IJG91_01275 [Candidatus Saccharibacteria bacterium]|nr:hypothetical protein [Candidatus Saccharibacteria bacterium]
MKIEAAKSNKGSNFVFSSSSGRSCRATLDLFSDAISSTYLTYNGDKWDNKSEKSEDVMLKLDSGEYAICPRFNIARKSPTGEEKSTLIFRVKHPGGGKVRLYLQLKEGKSISVNFSEKLTPEEVMDCDKQFVVHAVDILCYNGMYFISQMNEIPAEESECF